MFKSGPLAAVVSWVDGAVEYRGLMFPHDEATGGFEGVVAFDATGPQWGNLLFDFCKVFCGCLLRSFSLFLRSCRCPV
jgi:hypothetical protein